MACVETTAGSTAGEGGAEAKVELPTTPWLVCERCSFPLVSEAELIEEKFDTLKKVTWSYELGVLSREAIWCYSATNAHDNRFDVVRVLPSVISRSIRVTGEPTPEFSWFPGYSWSMAHCRQCNTHLGWGFSPDKPQGVSLAPSSPAESSATHLAGETTTSAMEVERDGSETARPGAASEASTGVPEAADGILVDASSATEDGEVAEEGLVSPAPSARSKEQLAFFGLVLTKMRERDLSAEAVKASLSELSSVQDRRSRARVAGRRLVQLLRNAPQGLDIRPFLLMAQRAFASGEPMDGNGLIDRVQEAYEAAENSTSEAASQTAAGVHAAATGGSALEVVDAIMAHDALPSEGDTDHGRRAGVGAQRASP